MGACMDDAIGACLGVCMEACTGIWTNICVGGMGDFVGVMIGDCMDDCIGAISDDCINGCMGMGMDICVGASMGDCMADPAANIGVDICIGVNADLGSTAPKLGPNGPDCHAKSASALAGSTAEPKQKSGSDGGEARAGRLWTLRTSCASKAFVAC